MAAGGAAVRYAPWTGASGIIPYSQTYVYGASSHGHSNIGGATAGMVHGPGTVTSIRFTTVGIIGVGFQLISIDDNGNPTPLIQSSPGVFQTQIGTAAFTPPSVPGWLAGDQAINPAMGPAYVYPIQEVLNQAAGNLGFWDSGISGGAVLPTVWTQYSATTVISPGQQFSFSNAFANGILTAGLGGTGASVVTQVTYSYFGQLAFGRDLRVIISPCILFNDSSGNAPSPPSINFQAQVAFD